MKTAVFCNEETLQVQSYSAAPERFFSLNNIDEDVSKILAQNIMWNYWLSYSVMH